MRSALGQRRRNHERPLRIHSQVSLRLCSSTPRSRSMPSPRQVKKRPLCLSLTFPFTVLKENNGDSPRQARDNREGKPKKARHFFPTGTHTYPIYTAFDERGLTSFVEGLLTGRQVRKRPARFSRRHFILKMIILPRQARDKHRKC